MKTLIDILHLHKNDVVSIVGTGGKTTLLYALGMELKNDYSVLLTTSTKIAKPLKGTCDFLYTSIEDYHMNHKVNKSSSITVISKGIILEKNKLIGIDDNDLESVAHDFDMVIIEADGSKSLPLKGWKNHEPVILEKTTKTIGIIPVKVLDKNINEDMIYGFEEFQKFSKEKKIIDNQLIGRICSDCNGIFKNSKKELYLYINQVDSAEDLIRAISLSNYLRENIIGKPFYFKICIGSSVNGIYYEFN